MAPMLQTTRGMDFDSPIERPILSPREAEQVVEQRIESFGLGALPQISVLEERGDWRISWDGKVRVTKPMNERDWLAWLEENVGEVDPESLSSLEG
jgi:hypothetical protein